MSMQCMFQIKTIQYRENPLVILIKELIHH